METILLVGNEYDFSFEVINGLIDWLEDKDLSYRFRKSHNVLEIPLVGIKIVPKSSNIKLHSFIGYDRNETKWKRVGGVDYNLATELNYRYGRVDKDLKDYIKEKIVDKFD